MAKSNYIEQDLHSEDLQEIIAKPPSWLLQRGISFILLTILMILAISVFIKYPEMVNATLKINTTFFRLRLNYFLRLIISLSPSFLIIPLI